MDEPALATTEADEPALATEEAVRVARIQSLQRAYGMEPRDDSKLTQLYARGDAPWGAEEVARELVCTDFLFSQTLYGQLLEDYMRGVAGRLRARHGARLAWGDTWRIVTFYAPIALKLQMVQCTGVRMPQLGLRVTRSVDQCA